MLLINVVLRLRNGGEGALAQKDFWTLGGTALHFPELTIPRISILDWGITGPQARNERSMLRWLNSLPSTTEPHPGDGVPAIQDNWYQVSFFRPDPKLSYADALNRNRRGHHGANPSPVKPVDWVPRVLQTQAIATDEAAEALRVAESSRAYQVPEPSDETTSNFSFRSGWASGCPSSGWGSRRYGRWLDSLRAHELAAESCYGVYPELGLEGKIPKPTTQMYETLC